MDAFDFEQMAKDIVTDRLKSVAPDEVPSVSADIVRDIVVSGVASTGAKQDPRMTVSGTCRGAMGGLLLLEKDLPSAAVAILAESAAIANETGLDPGDMMTWAIEGIAPVARMAGSNVEGAVQEAIEAKYMGAGEAFAAACRSAGT